MRSLGVALLTAIAIAALPTGAAAQGEGRLDLPVVAFDAPEGIVDEPKHDATMRVYDRRRREEHIGPVGIEFRGYSSQEDPKKSYALETRKPSGKNDNVSLLGMPKDDDWVLIAAYRDESLLRNYIAYSAARWLGHYAPRNRLVEVAVNNRYEGVFLLAEDLKVHDDRVAVDDSDLSGGYLLEMISMRRAQGESFFTTPVLNLPIVYKDPSGDDISNGRAFWIRDYLRRFERRLYGDRFRNRRRGYRRVLDVNAAVDFVLLNELFRNADTFRNSTYMHKGVGGKLVLGPLWDFDHALGNDGNAADNSTTGWEYSGSPWAGRLYADPAFRRAMVRRWSDVRRGLMRHVERTIDRGVRRLGGGPQERNFSRWPTFGTRVGGPADPRTGNLPANHAEAVDYLQWWVAQRSKWMKRNFTQLQP